MLAVAEIVRKSQLKEVWGERIFSTKEIAVMRAAELAKREGRSQR